MGSKWFKHWNEASEGLSIQSLLANGDHEAVACYWILLEQVSKFGKPDAPGHIEISVSLLAKRWFVSCPKVERILDRLVFNMRSTLDCTLSTSSPKVASITVRNWLEFNASWGGKREARFEQEVGRYKKKEERYTPPQESAGSSEGLTECIAEHQETLKNFGITRQAILSDQDKIVRALRKHGFDAVRSAIVGARKEQKTDKFDPAKYYSLARVLSDANLEKFVNLGSQNQKPKSDVKTLEEIEKELA